jgi:arylsulfatase A-like enzyme
MSLRHGIGPLVALVAVFATLAVPAAAQDRPNILVIWGDDVGRSNISAYTMGMHGYRTPNIDRIANEGMIFTDYYGEQSCTAGRSSFIMGASSARASPRSASPGPSSACASKTRRSPSS